MRWTIGRAVSWQLDPKIGHGLWKIVGLGLATSLNFANRADVLSKRAGIGEDGFYWFVVKDASEEVIHKRILEIEGDGGLIAVDAQGHISMPFNTEGMYRASKTSDGDELIAIYK